MFGIGTKEIIIIAIVLVVLFGARKIPELAESLVESIRTLRKAFSSDDTAVAKKK